MKKQTIQELLTNIYYNVPEAETITLGENSENLSTNQMHILRLIDHGERKTPEAVARGLGLGIRTLECSLSILEQKGCITRQKPTEGESECSLALTEKGEKALAGYRNVIREGIGTMVQDMSDEDVNSIIKGLGLLDEYLQQITNKG